ncbi:MAG: DUF2490 domain-containing protein [Chitinophagaceae bacterium]|nr:DUF2490 domain-containing protein [Chitinophagaceae bacterium]MBL0337398.1 DUF2490 domain-containing protein [Chitinophagaceae bacterium]
MYNLFGTQSLGKRRPDSSGCLFLLFVMLLIQVVPVQAQEKKSTSAEQVWLAYFNQTRLSDRWGLWGDFHLRTKDNLFSGLNTGIARVGLTYYANDDLKLTAGYAFVNHFPADNHADVSRPEHRPWQQVQWHTKYKKLRLMQWIRLEERFRRKILDASTLAPGTNFNFRVRYNLFTMFPLSKKRFQPGTLSWVINNELHINFGKEIVYNYFDQDRFFTGVQYHVNSHDSFQFGYQYVFQQLASGSSYKKSHVIRCYYFHNPDLRKKNKK